MLLNFVDIAHGKLQIYICCYECIGGTWNMHPPKNTPFMIRKQQVTVWFLPRYAPIFKSIIYIRHQQVFVGPPYRHPYWRHGGNAGISMKIKSLRWKVWWLQDLACRPIVSQWCNLPPRSWIQTHLRQPSEWRLCLGLAPTNKVETLNVTTSSVWDMKLPKNTTLKPP